MSKREEFIQLPPYVDFRGGAPPSQTTVYRCTCGWSLAPKGPALAHIVCQGCGGVAISTKV